METLSDFNLSKIKEDIAPTLRDKIQENNMYFLFPLFHQEMLYFAIDNVDVKIDTPYGKNQLHGTVIMAYQNETTKKKSLTLLLCEAQKGNISEVKIRFIKLNTVSLQTVQIQNVKIMFHGVQLIKLNFILQIIRSGVY